MDLLQYNSSADPFVVSGTCISIISNHLPQRGLSVVLATLQGELSSYLSPVAVLSVRSTINGPYSRRAIVAAIGTYKH